MITDVHATASRPYSRHYVSPGKRVSGIIILRSFLDIHLFVVMMGG